MHVSQRSRAYVQTTRRVLALAPPIRTRGANKAGAKGGSILKRMGSHLLRLIMRALWSLGRARGGRKADAEADATKKRAPNHKGASRRGDHRTHSQTCGRAYEYVRVQYYSVTGRAIDNVGGRVVGDADVGV